MKKLLFTLSICFLFAGVIRSQCVGNCTLYTVSSIAPVQSPTAGATGLVLGDDQLSAAVPIGFTFTYMCIAYTNAYICSNGFISFNPACSQGCCSGQIDPTVGGNPNNYVAIAWNDLYPPGAGTINYVTLGVAPNRVFVVTYSLIPFCCGAGPPNVSGQIKLYETTNVIEIHNFNVGNQGNNQTQGIMDAGGLSGFTVPGRNAVPWTAIDDAWSFSPSPALPPCSGTPTAGISQASPTTACATYTTALSLSGSVQQCSLTYQWQSAPALAGPYTNIAGATASLATVTNSSATIYYRCIVTCGANSATSTPVNCVIPPCAGTPTPGTAVANPSIGCLHVTTNLSLTGTVAACGLNYQWQSAPALAGPYTNIAGATTLTVSITTSVTTYYRCLLTCGGNTAVSVATTVSITPGPCPTCVGQYYLRSSIGEPWGFTNNPTSMTAVFGATWTLAFYETVNPVTVFQPTISFVYMEGGDDNALAMNTFVTANIITIQNWVANGGHLLMNAAPNQGGNMNWGFGGVTLNYPNYSTPGTAAVGQAGHPIFNGPYLPAGTAYTGTWWSHAVITGPVIDIIDGTGGITLGELNYGAGKAMFGGMTSWGWHAPVPNSQNLLQNIFVYLNCAPIVLPIELMDYYLNYNGQNCQINWVTATEKNTDYYIVERSIDGINYDFLGKVPAAGNSMTTKKYSTTDFNPNKNGVTYYRLKEFDMGDNNPKLNLVKTIDVNENNIQKIRIQPNPANVSLDVFLPSSFSTNSTLQVFDNSGKRVLSIQLNNITSVSAYNLNIESLESGFYSLQIFDDSGNSATKTFIKN